MRIPFLLLLAACSPSAHKVLTSYLQAEQSGQYDEAYALLTPSDQSARTLDTYVTEHLSAGPVWLAVARRTRFELAAPQTTPDATVVPVTALHADLEALGKLLPAPPADQLAAAEDRMAFENAWYAAELSKHEVDEVAEALTYSLRDEGAGWRVWLGLDRQDAAVALWRKADVATDAGDAATTRTALTQLLTLPHDPSGVVQALQTEARQRIAALDAQGR